MSYTQKSGSFEPPPYPYDRLQKVIDIASSHVGGAVNLSIGAPCDPPAQTVLDALGSSQSEQSYPPSIGTAEFRSAAANWLNSVTVRAASGSNGARNVDLAAEDVRATIGSKEFVAGLPHWLRLRRPDRDTVLYPSISYPSYAMGATLAGCRAVPVDIDENWRIDLSTVAEQDIERALCLWVNTPSNPTGALDDLEAVAAWGAAHDVLVVSDECYVEFTWRGQGQSILGFAGPHSSTARYKGLIAVHSLSKRSNFAGARAGFYAGDTDWIHYLGEVRKHAGLMAPGPTQAAAVAAFADSEHVESQKKRYLDRLNLMCGVLNTLDVEATLPEGGFYLWVRAPQDDAWSFAQRLARDAGAVVSPGEFYGPAGASHVRVAAVQPMDKLELIAKRLGFSG